MLKGNILESKLYEWAMLIALMLLTQVLWIGCTVLGGIIFGYYPATIAAFKMIRHFQQSDGNLQHLPKYFWECYKEHFLKANIVGVANVVIAYLLITNIRITSSLQSNVAIYIFTLQLFTIVLFLVIQPYILVVMAVSKDTMKRTITCAVLLAFSSPISSFFILLLSAAYLIGIWLIPSLYMVIGITVPLLLLTQWAEGKIKIILHQEQELVTT